MVDTGLFLVRTVPRKRDVLYACADHSWHAGLLYKTMQDYARLCKTVQGCARLARLAPPLTVAAQLAMLAASPWAAGVVMLCILVLLLLKFGVEVVLVRAEVVLMCEVQLVVGLVGLCWPVGKLCCVPWRTIALGLVGFCWTMQ
jgi:hypothetical protein